MLKNISGCAVLVLLLLLTLAIRIQGAGNIADRQFTETDAYFYYWQASLISEHGHLPARDMHRWLPLGRDLGQTLNLYGYVLAYTHKAIAWIFPNITLYLVCFYMPVVCFCIGLGALCLYLYHAYGLLFSSIVGVILATLPGSIERSTAGFGDRDAFCLMIGIFSVVTYLSSLQTQTHRKRLLWTLASGFTVFLGGMSWEGFGVFLSVIIVVELYRFLTSEIAEGFGFYGLWVCCFVPTLYLAATAYRNGYGFAEHLAAFVLMPPLLLLAMRAIRSLLLSKVDLLRLHARTVSLGLILTSVTLVLSYVWIQQKTFADTTVPLSQNAVMTAMTELRNPHFGYWVFRYGGVFILGSIGLIVASKRYWHQTCLLVPLVLFIATTFFREPLEEHLWNASHGTFFFSMAVICTGIGFLISAWLEKSNAPRLMTIVAFMMWLIFWVSLSRDAKRYDFFIGVPLAYGTAWLLYLSPAHLIQTLKNAHRLPPHLSERRVSAIVSLTVLIAVLFLNPLGGHLNRAGYAAAEMRKPTPGRGTPLEQTLTWIKTILPSTAVVAAHWGYGNHLNTLAGVKTINDPDHYLPHWIHLYYRHVFCAQSEREVLGFLKTHGATHLMLTKRGVTARSANYAALGSENNDRHFDYIRLLSLSNQRLSRTKQTPFLYIEAPDITSPPPFLTAYLKSGALVKLPYLIDFGTDRSVYNTAEADTRYGGILLYYREDGRFQNADALAAVGWNSLALRLYQRGELSDIFVPVYPTKGDADADFKVWEIHYPPDIPSDPKYLKTGIPEIDKTLGLQ